MAYILSKAVNFSGKDYFMNTLDIALSEREIYLTGEISEENAMLVCSAIRCLARESTDDITLYIQSPGGSVSAGLSIFDTCQAVRCDICTVACGMAASMAAFLVCCAGTKGKRYVQPNAEMMIHQPLGGAQGQVTDIRIRAEHAARVKDRLNCILAEATGQDLSTIERDTDRDNYMTAEEAVAYGLADLIGEPAGEL